MEASISLKGKYVNGKIVLPHTLPLKDGSEVMVTVQENVSHTDNDKQPRQPGGLKGKVNVPDNFNEIDMGLEEYM